jgi:hypothetical protein
MSIFGIAAILSILGTIALHLYDCSVGTYEQCLMSRGLLWLYFPVMFVFCLIVVALVREVIDWLNCE